MDNIFHLEPHAEFEKAIREVVCSYYYCASNVTKKSEDSPVIKAAKDDLKKILLDSNFDTNKIPELLLDKNWNAEKIVLFVNLLNEKKTELLYASLIQQNSVHGETVTNFDWVLKLVLGTSELNTLKYPLLQLIFSTDNNGAHKKIMYDINKDMLLKIIDLLEQLDEV